MIDSPRHIFPKQSRVSHSHKLYPWDTRSIVVYLPRHYTPGSKMSRPHKYHQRLKVRVAEANSLSYTIRRRHWACLAVWKNPIPLRILSAVPIEIFFSCGWPRRRETACDLRGKRKYASRQSGISAIRLRWWWRGRTTPITVWQAYRGSWSNWPTEQTGKEGTKATKKNRGREEYETGLWQNRNVHPSVSRRES